jgi:hypothetical protein
MDWDDPWFGGSELHYNMFATKVELGAVNPSSATLLKEER